MKNRNPKSKIAARKGPSVLLAVAEEGFAFAMSEFVEQHNWPEDTQFHVFYVVEEPSIRRVLRFSPDIAQDVIDEDKIYGARLVKKIEAHLRKAIPKAKIETSVGGGFAKNEILSKADEVNANFIVVGSHGRLGISSILLGSVSIALMMEANCSVLVLKMPDSKAKGKESETLTSVDDLPKRMTSYCER